MARREVGRVRMALAEESFELARKPLRLLVRNEVSAALEHQAAQVLGKRLQ